MTNTLIKTSKGETLEKKKIEESLLSLASAIGKDGNLRIEPAPKKGMWAFCEDNNTFYYSLDDVIEYGIDFGYGVSLHEGGHRRITRIKNLIKGPEGDQFSKIFNSYGFHLLLNGVEDPRVNNFVMSKFDTGGKNLRESYLRDFKNKEEDIAAKNEKVGFENYGKSKHWTFIWGIIQNWYLGDITIKEIPDLEVLHLLKKNKEHFDLIKHSFSIAGDDKEQTDIFKHVVLLTYQKIYPDFIYLLEKDKEALKNLVQDLLDKGINPFGDKGDGDDKGGGGGGSGLDMELDFGDSKGGEKAGGEKGGFSFGKGDQRPMSDDEIRKALESAMENAAKELSGQEAKEDGTLKEPDKFGSKQGESIKLPANYRGYEDRLDEELRKTILKEREAQRKKFQKELKQGYDKYFLEVEPYIKALTNKLKTIVQKNKMDYEDGYNGGDRLNTDTFLRRHFAKESYKIDYFERVTDPVEYDYGVSFCIDLSGSMNGDRLKNAFKGLVIFIEAMTKLKIPFEIIGFGLNTKAEVEVLKSFKEKLTDNKREQLVADVFGKNGGGTPDFTAVALAVKDLIKNNHKDSLLFVLTDGGSSNPEELHKSLDSLEKRFGKPGIGIGIGEGVDEVELNYKRPIKIHKLEDLVGQFILLFKEFFFN